MCAPIGRRQAGGQVPEQNWVNFEAKSVPRVGCAKPCSSSYGNRATGSKGKGAFRLGRVETAALKGANFKEIFFFKFVIYYYFEKEKSRFLYLRIL